MKTRLFSVVKSLIGLPLTLLALFFIFRIIITQLPTLTINFHTLHVFVLGYGIISFILFYFLRSYIWYRILKNKKYSLSFQESSYLWALSELKRYIPGNIWSFLGRTVLFQQKNVEKKDIAKGLIFEAELFVIGCAVISLLALPFYFSKAQSFISYSITALVVVFIIVYCCNELIREKLAGRLKQIVSYLLPFFPTSENIFLIWISIIAVFFFGLGNYFTISSVVYLNPERLPELIGVFAFAFVAGYLSIITPAGFGVREGIVIVSLSKIVSSGAAAFGALLSRLVLIISELLFILLCTLWHKFPNKKFRQLENLIITHPQVSILSVLTVIYSLYFTIVSFLRYDNFYTGRFDLGNMAQTVWNSLHGRIFLFTDPNGTQEISRLAFHADFLLVLLAPLYALWQDPRMLLLIQTIVIAAGAFFVYIISKDVLKNKNLALTFAFIFLLNPSVERTNLYDFHAVTLATTFFFATYYFYLHKRYKLFLVFVLLAALCKEELWLIVALFGVLVFFVHKKRIFGSILFFFSVAMFYFLFWYAIPKTLGAQHFALAYLSDFGDSPTKVVKNMILSPNKIVQTILLPSRIGYLIQIFQPVGFLSIFFPFFLIFAGPDLLIDLLSNNPQLHQIYYQYTATITPFIFLSAIYGIYWLRKGILRYTSVSQKNLTLYFIIYLLSFGIYSAYASGPLPGARDANLDMFIRQLPNREYVNTFLLSIPKKYSVAASNDLGSHLTSREKIYAIPYGINRADVIVLLLDGSDPEAKVVYKQVSNDPRYHLITQNGSFVAFQRN